MACEPGLPEKNALKASGALDAGGRVIGNAGGT